jgi:predicted house-cleaning NTP pyrophosphatase (Maf/HAM1 superfamily)
MDSGFEEDLDKKSFATAEEYVSATSKGKMDYMLKKLAPEDFDFIITCDTICVDSNNVIIEKPVI